MKLTVYDTFQIQKCRQDDFICVHEKKSHTRTGRDRDPEQTQKVPYRTFSWHFASWIKKAMLTARGKSVLFIIKFPTIQIK